MGKDAIQTTVRVELLSAAGARAARWRIAKPDRHRFTRGDDGLAYDLPQRVRLLAPLAFEDGGDLAIQPGGVVRLDCVSGGGGVAPGSRIIAEFEDASGAALGKIAKPFSRERLWVRIPAPSDSARVRLTLGLSGSGALTRMCFTAETESFGSVERGARALEAGDINDARDALEAADRFRPLDPALPRLKALTAWMSQDYRETAVLYRELDRQGALRGDDATRLFRSLKRTGEFDEAERVLAAHLDPVNLSDGLLREWTDLALERRDVDAAVERFQRLMARGEGLRSATSILIGFGRRGGWGVVERVVVRLRNPNLANDVAAAAQGEHRYVVAARLFEHAADCWPEAASEGATGRAEQAWMHAFAKRSLAADWKSATTGRATSAEEAVRRTGAYDIVVDGHTFPIRFKRGRGDRVLLLFHGAADQTVRPYPHFAAFVPGLETVHQIAFADPTVAGSPDLTAGWYLGTQDTPVQTLMPGLIQSLCDVLGGERRVYLGGSSGGFAALCFSWCDPGSIAVAANPQIDLNAYLEKPIERLIELGWPGLASRQELAQQVCLDVSRLYRERCPNVVAYVQSRADWKHVANQLPVFVQAAAEVDGSVAFDIGYWGVPGHSGSAPPEAYLPWVYAALKAPEVSLASLMDTHDRSRIADQQSDPKVSDDVETAFADRLAKTMLSRDPGVGPHT